MAKTILFLDDERQGMQKTLSFSGKIIFREKLTEEYACIHDYARDFPQNKEFYNHEWFQRWAASAPVLDGKTMKEVLIFEDYSLWYFFEKFLFVDIYPARLCTPVSRALYFVDVIKKILAIEKPRKVVVQHLKDDFHQIVRDVCLEKSISFETLSRAGAQQTFSNSLYNTVFLGRAYFRFRIAARFALGILSRRAPAPADAILLSNERFCVGDSRSNTFWGGVVRELEKKSVSFTVLEYDPLWTMRGFLHMFTRHAFASPVHTTSMAAYYHPRDFRAIGRIARHLNSLWKRLRVSKKFQSSFVYQGIDLYPYVRDRFAIAFEAFSFYAADSIVLTRRVLEHLSPRVVVMDHEMNYYGLGFFHNKNTCSFRTLALQFESVNMRNCIHAHINDLSVRKKSSPLWRPLPDVKCCSGLYAKQVLIKSCNYPSDIITITGQAQFDRLRLLSSAQTPGLYKKFSLDPKKKTIVFASNFRDNEESTWAELKRIVRERIDLQIVFTLASMNDLSSFRKRIGQEPRVFVEKNIDLPGLLAITDILITVRSTVAMEAMCVQKPVMLVDYYGSCPFPYVQMGAAFGVQRISELETGLLHCLYDAHQRRSLIAGGRRFLNEYFYKLDGQASSRTAAVIMKELRAKNA